MKFQVTLTAILVGIGIGSHTLASEKVVLNALCAPMEETIQRKYDTYLRKSKFERYRRYAHYVFELGQRYQECLREPLTALDSVRVQIFATDDVMTQRSYLGRRRQLHHDCEQAAYAAMGGFHADADVEGEGQSQHIRIYEADFVGYKSLERWRGWKEGSFQNEFQYIVCAQSGEDWHYNEFPQQQCVGIPDLTSTKFTTFATRYRKFNPVTERFTHHSWALKTTASSLDELEQEFRKRFLLPAQYVKTVHPSCVPSALASGISP